jgi:NAD(P)-dependent dehydrogenase (short-subunit alcohol dehydrogenase family)
VPAPGVKIAGWVPRGREIAPSARERTVEIREFAMDLFGLGGKHAIVTGGNTGLGQAFALALAKGGADVFVPSIVDDDGSTREMIESEGVRYEFVQADITEPGTPRRVVDTCVERLGSVDILVNSAGICPLAEVLDFDRTKWDATIAVNLTAAFEMSYEVAQRMVPQRSGKIINICSMFSFLGGRFSPAYAATKHGIAGLTKAYCDELAMHNIQVNGIAPGYFATAITATTRSNPDTNRRVLEHIPTERWGEPADLMGTVVFLASRASDYVNGHILAVDGGYLVR